MLSCALVVAQGTPNWVAGPMVLEAWRPFSGVQRAGAETPVMPNQAAYWPPLKSRIAQMLAYAMDPLLRGRKTAVGLGWVPTWRQACVSSGHPHPPLDA
eukprot:COSAG01_NODE_5184_length_4426_cov_1.320777_4_plen_99_part_00